MRSARMLTVLAAMLLVGGPAAASELTAEQIVDKALEHSTFGFENAIAKVTLVLTSKRGSERTRQIEIRSRQHNDLTKTLVRFHAPADVAGTGFLVLENDGRDDDQYLYLPALGKVKRITSSQRNQRFMGTDLTYADLESRNLRNGKTTRLPDEKVGQQDAYKLESFPAEGEDTEYGKTITWVHKTSFVPLKVDFFDKQLAPLKTMKVLRLEKKDGQWVVMDSVVENVQESTKTQMRVESLNLKANLADNEFTEDALKGG